MKLPFSMFLGALSEKRIYRFNLAYLTNPVAHYYVCVKVESKFVWFTCCTSQFDSNLQRIYRNRQKLDTLVLVGDKTTPPFVKDTYVNCNSAEELSISDIQKMYEAEEFTYESVEVDDAVFDLIVKGILMSNQVSRKLQKLLMEVE